MRRTAVVAALLLASALVAGCGPDDEEAPTVTTATTVAAPPTSGTSVPAPPAGNNTGAGSPPPDAPFATTAVSVPPAPYTYLTAVRAARHDGFDRVVFEFEPATPGYRVGYVERPIVEDGSGERVEVDGGGVLEVHMEAASGVRLDRDKAHETYAGPRRIRPGTSAVIEVVRVGDFEANLDWAVGVRRPVPFRVFTLTGPPRLVVDVTHVVS